jgi:hypothetical protein
MPRDNAFIPRSTFGRDLNYPTDDYCARCSAGHKNKLIFMRRNFRLSSDERDGVRGQLEMIELVARGWKLFISVLCARSDAQYSQKRFVHS